MMSLLLGPRLLQVQLCSVCRRAIDSPCGSLQEDQVVQALVGVAKYAKCPCCGHSVESWDSAYKQRYRRFIKRLSIRRKPDGNTDGRKASGM